jgi:methylenetetrahydrofolate reductase (NADPH)
MRVSVELIPRSEADLAEQLLDAAHVPGVDTINLPDLTRFPYRSWDACRQVGRAGYRTVAHVRAIDVAMERPLPFEAALHDGTLDEVLVVAGDAPADMSREVHPTTSVQVISRIVREAPHVTVYAALDPYRQSIAAEVDYVRRKVDAGAAGVFTQPFFDVRLMAVWADALAGLSLARFWGATSVTSLRSARYWTTRNGAVLPSAFAPTLEHSRALARSIHDLARELGDDVYFMPIRASCVDYLGDVVRSSST